MREDAGLTITEMNMHIISKMLKELVFSFAPPVVQFQFTERNQFLRRGEVEICSSRELTQGEKEKIEDLILRYVPSENVPKTYIYEVTGGRA